MLEQFKVSELVDKETFELLGDNAIKLLDMRLKMTIDSIRKHFNVPLTINNWSTGGAWKDRCYRTMKSTTGKIGGVHFRGLAVDLDVQGKKVS